MRKIHTEIKGRVMLAGFRQEELAEKTGYNTATFSRILRGRVDTPADFEDRVGAALDLMERAERAAHEARDRVMSEAT